MEKAFDNSILAVLGVMILKIYFCESTIEIEHIEKKRCLTSHIMYFLEFYWLFSNIQIPRSLVRSRVCNEHTIEREPVC